MIKCNAETLLKKNNEVFKILCGLAALKILHYNGTKQIILLLTIIYNNPYYNSCFQEVPSQSVSNSVLQLRHRNVCCCLAISPKEASLFDKGVFWHCSLGICRFTSPSREDPVIFVWYGLILLRQLNWMLSDN